MSVQPLSRPFSGGGSYLPGGHVPPPLLYHLPPNSGHLPQQIQPFTTPKNHSFARRSSATTIFFGFYYWIDAITITLTKWFNVVQLNNATQTIFRDGAQPLSVQWPARGAQEKVLEAEKSFFKQLAIGWGGISLNVGGHCRFFASCSLCCWLKRLPEWKIDTLIMMT